MKSVSQETGSGPARRDVLRGVAAVALASAGGASAAPLDDLPIIDAHIHLFDGTRPQGAPYMGSRAYAATSKVFLPSAYRPLARPAGIVGAVAVEASGWLEDNLWLLETAQDDPMMVGVVGRLDTGRPDFREFFGRFSKNPLFRGIRHWRFYNEADGKVALNPADIEGMKRLADADCSLDTANPSLALLEADLLLADAVPNLRIIVDHLPAFDPTPQQQVQYERLVKELAARPNVFVKLTEVYHPRADGLIVRDEVTLQTRLRYLYAAFGADRVLFGTDYPNSHGVATILEAVALMKRFFSDKPLADAEKYFWRNSARIYKWAPRAPDQPRAS